MKQVKIKLEGGFMPTKGSNYAAAYDLYCPQDIDLKAGRQVVDLLFCLELPPQLAATVQPRSGFSCKGMEVEYHLEDGTVVPDYRLDADVVRGLIDEDFRNHCGVIVKVHQKIGVNERAVLKKGTRFAQLQIVNVPETYLFEVNELDYSKDRGGGYGHTGTK